MLIEQKQKHLKKTATFRLDSALLDEFRALCKKHELKQVSIIENAMEKAILEIKEMEKDNEHDKD